MTDEKRENRLLRYTLLTFLVSGASAQPLGSLIPYLRQAYGFSYDLAGVLLSFQSIGNLIAVLCGGFLSVMLGRRRSILATSVWMAVAYLIIASGIGSPALVVLACFMTGIARGGNSTFSSTMISTLPGAKAVRGYNLLHGFFAIGALASPMLLVLCSNLWPQNGWRIMALCLALLVVLQVIGYARMPIPPQQQSPEKGKHRSVDRSFLKVPKFWLGAAMIFFYISTEYAIVGWLVTYFQDIGVLSADLAQLMNSLLWLVILIGRLIGAAITSKVSGSKLLLVDGVGFFVFFLLVFLSRTPAPIVVGIIGAGLFMATIYPTAFAFGSECIKGNDVGTGVMMFIGSIGGIVTPALVGVVAQWAGIQAGMGVVVILTALLLLSILLSVFSTRAKEPKAG